jgi:hypothetical protein
MALGISLRNVTFVISACLQPEDGGSKLLRNACNYLLTKTGLYFGRLRSHYQSKNYQFVDGPYPQTWTANVSQTAIVN